MQPVIRFVLFVTADGLELVRLHVKNEIEVPSITQEIDDPKCGIVVQGKSLGDLEHAIANAVAELGR